MRYVENAKDKVDEIKLEVQNVFAGKQCSTEKTPQSPSESLAGTNDQGHLQQLSSTRIVLSL